MVSTNLDAPNRYSQNFRAETGVSSGGFNPNDLEWKSEKFFVYQATFKNETGRKIRGFVWEYVFSDLETKDVIKRHKFSYIRKLKNRKTLTMQGKSVDPPTTLVSAEGLEKNARSPYDETIEVKCIVFDDDTTWKKNDAAEEQCKELRRDIKLREEFLKRF